MNVCAVKCLQFIFICALLFVIFAVALVLSCAVFYYVIGLLDYFLCYS